MYKKDDIIGKKFNKLTCIKFVGLRKVPSGNTRRIYLFRCDCGNEKELGGSVVKTEGTISCGCINIKQITKLGKRLGVDRGNFKHGFFGTRFYKIYSGMVDRTRHHKRFYENIKCDWKSFEEFRDDMYPSYSIHVREFGERQTTLDRINSAGNYNKINCRWATYKEQQNNRKDNFRIQIDGEVKNLVEWSKLLNIGQGVLSRKVKRGEIGLRI